jgi:exodeoxyribonuclease VII large subunit
MQIAISVTELTSSIKQLLESSLGEVLIQGEISNFKPHSSGHCYFVLKDAGAQIQAVMFRAKAASLKVLPKEGDAVIARGQITVYEQRGQYQIIVSEIKPQGLGALLAKLEELKKAYAAKGYFDVGRKKPLPPFPTRIGVITSPTGAVIQDILHILKRRAGHFHLILNPVKVQGEGAAAEIALAIDQMNEHKLADVLIVGRGGGSIEDLWAFNEPPVIEAIYRSQIPIISAVGHETDFTLADLVADLRAPTPSAAAEIVTKERGRLLEKLASLTAQTSSFIHNTLHLRRQKLITLFKHPFLLSAESFLSKRYMQVDECEMRIDRHMHTALMRAKLLLSQKSQLLQEQNPQNRLKTQQKKLLGLSLSLDRELLAALTLKRTLLEKHTSSLIAMNPKKILSRGYSLLFSKDKKRLVYSSHDLSPGDLVTAEFADGITSLIVTEN